MQDVTVSGISADLLSPQELVRKAQAHFEALRDPRITGSITRDSLQRAADGQPLYGVPPTQEQIEIAQEILKRRDFFIQLDATSGVDGLISRDDLATESGDYQYLSDRALIKLVGKNFNEFGGGDEFVNFNELREAAGEIPSTKNYTPQARGVAKELLQPHREDLLNRLDIGVGLFGFSGSQDQRFDMLNVEHTSRNSSTESRYPE
ncbi:hypothetical protein [Pseudomonas synxantha]|uniref:hypothetical protein n=1 Tax=Pseudomonas synxantha TaxID=47883 RepID=UPI0019D1A15F|nr:hypothetical protein [Pseudomonas synxantha]